MLLVAVRRLCSPAGPCDADAPTWLGDSERARWPGLSDAARPSFLASRALARRLLAQSSGVAFERWTLGAESGAAPAASLRAAPGCGPHAAPHVSLSHRLGHVAAAVGAHALGPVGVDLECERPARSDPGERAALMLAPSELAAWRALSESRREPALLHAWIAKEAWFKATPHGEAPWNFRAIEVCPAVPTRANVRIWHAAPVHVAVCCADAHALAAARCDGLPGDPAAPGTFWRVARADSKPPAP